MKTKIFFLSTLLIAMLGVCGCSGDDEEQDIGLDEKALLSQTEPLYKSSRNNISSLPQTEKKVGDWRFVMNGDYITEVSFGSFGNESDYAKAPASAEAFFEEYLPLTKDNYLKLGEESTSGGRYHKTYQQYYKGVIVKSLYICYYQPDDKTPQYMQGFFIPISNLDVKPHVSEKLARRIAMAYTSKGQQETPGEGWNLSAELRITNYIIDGKPHIHLIYDCTLWSDAPWSSMENVTIDAHTGRILTYSLAIA